MSLRDKQLKEKYPERKIFRQKSNTKQRKGIEKKKKDRREKVSKTRNFKLQKRQAHEKRKREKEKTCAETQIKRA
jgi:hypothetical protein